MPTILLIEDDDLLGDMMKLYLSRNGFEVRLAQSGDEALTVLSNDEVALVLMDWQIPGISREELIAAIKQSHADLPIIVTSGEATSHFVTQVKDAGADQVLRKPFELDAMVEAVRVELNAN